MSDSKESMDILQEYVWTRSKVEVKEAEVKVRDPCTICLDSMSKKRVCCHTCLTVFCFECMKTHAEVNTTMLGVLRCPSCRMSFLSKHHNPLDPNEKTIREIVDKKKKPLKKCNNCGENLLGSARYPNRYYVCPKGCSKRCIACDEDINEYFHRWKCSEKKMLKSLRNTAPCPVCLIMIEKTQGCTTVFCHCGTSMNWGHDQRYHRRRNKK